MLVICFPLSSHSTNVDSLKQAFKTTENQRDECFVISEIYNHYKELGQVDSMNLYARNAIRVCDFNYKDHYLILYNLIVEQYKGGFAKNIYPVIDSVLLQIANPDDKLEYLIFQAENNYLFDTLGVKDKYLQQAEEVINYTSNKYSKHIYYSYIGLKERLEGNTFASLQSYKLAAKFAEKEENILLNKSEQAYLYLLNGEVEKSKVILNELIESTKDKKFVYSTIWIYFSIIECYYESEDFEEVIRLCHESIAYSNPIVDKHELPLGYVYSFIGKSYLELANLDSTKYYLDKGIAYSLEHNDSKELADNYFVLSDYYRAIGNREKARLYLTKAQGEKSYYDNLEIDKKFADLMAEDKNYNEAYSYLNKYANKVLQKEKDEKEDLVLATKLIEDSYRHKQELKSTLSKAKQKENRLRNIIIFIISGILFIAILLAYGQRNRSKLEELNNKISQRNKELDVLILKQKDTIKYLDNFASVAAHDLKAPIRTASSFAGLLARVSGDKLSDKEKEYLNYVGTSVAQLSGMIDDLLSLSRLDNDLPELKQIKLNETIFEVETILSNLLGKTNSKIIIEAPLPEVMGHSTLLRQLFQNIIKNAIVHNTTDNATIVKISSESTDNKKFVIKISDNSGGIPDYIIPNMFDLFSSSNKNSGNGIGLATCKKIVNHYGGEIWVDVNPGVGSTFNFSLFG